ncbi:MAG: type II toxin-antitoxin system ParD family antitoxin [Paracoccaceae bacterium]|nr:type II toxin-antitoxin system ParD family antitoxin [Paracoccaceae bacterium]
MPNVSLTPQMQEFAEAQVASGAYANVSEVVRAGMRKLMDEDGYQELLALRAELHERMKEPAEEVDLREVLFGKSEG